MILTVLVTSMLAAPPELVALEGKVSPQEFLERAEKIEPAQRDATWRTMVGKSAAGVVDQRSAKDPFFGATKAEELTRKFNFLDQDAAFLAARDRAIIVGGNQCIAQGDQRDECWKTVDAYEKQLSNAGAFEWGKALASKGWLPMRVMPLLGRGVEAVEGAPCKEKAVLDATLGALDLPFEAPGAVAAREVAFNKCWKTMEPKVRASMVGASSYKLKNSCKALRAKKALTELQLDLCTDEGE